MRHPYHLVEPSPWPMLISLNLLFLLISFLGYLNGYIYTLLNLKLTLGNCIVIILFWLYDIITESLYMGFHSYKVSKGLILGFLLFVLTEIMLFFSLFWGYFHSALNPYYLVWPPVGIDLLNPWNIPLLNTLLLLYSGIAATFAHHGFISNKRNLSIVGLIISIILGFIFVLLQGFEYFSSSFDLSDSIYSSCFYLLTGTHGLHVIVGLLFLVVVLIRISFYHSTSLVYNLALIYYHFVDIVWILLFILIYYFAY